MIAIILCVLFVVGFVWYGYAGMNEDEPSAKDDISDEDDD